MPAAVRRRRPPFWGVVSDGGSSCCSVRGGVLLDRFVLDLDGWLGLLRGCLAGARGRELGRLEGVESSQERVEVLRAAEAGGFEHVLIALALFADLYGQLAERNHHRLEPLHRPRPVLYHLLDESRLQLLYLAAVGAGLAFRRRREHLQGHELALCPLLPGGWFTLTACAEAQEHDRTTCQQQVQVELGPSVQPPCLTGHTVLHGEAADLRSLVEDIVVPIREGGLASGEDLGGLAVDLDRNDSLLALQTDHVSGTGGLLLGFGQGCLSQPVWAFGDWCVDSFFFAVTFCF